MSAGEAQRSGEMAQEESIEISAGSVGSTMTVSGEGKCGCGQAAAGDRSRRVKGKLGQVAKN